MRLTKSPVKITPFFCLTFAYLDPKPNVDKTASSHSVRAVAHDTRTRRFAASIRLCDRFANRAQRSGIVPFRFATMSLDTELPP